MTFSLETPILLLVDSAFLICQERNELFKLAKLFPALPHSGQILQVRNEKKKCFFLFDEAEREWVQGTMFNTSWRKFSSRRK